MKDWRILKICDQFWSIFWVFTASQLLTSVAVPDPDAFHEITKDEYESFLRELHPPKQISFDTEVARYKRQAGIESYEYNSDDPEQGPWQDWGPPSTCSR